MKDLNPASRVESAAGKQNEQIMVRTLDSVPARYRNHPSFDQLAIDPAHGSKPKPKTIREAMSAIEAELSGFVKGPVERSDTPYIDFFDAEGYPFDVKTPLSPTYQDHWPFDPAGNANTILKQLGMHHKNKITGEEQQVAVLLDTTYITPEDHQNLWRELRKQTKENRSVLNRIFEVNVKLDDKMPEQAQTKPLADKKIDNKIMTALLQRGR